MKAWLTVLLLLSAARSQAADDPLAWPSARAESRPWSYWWWLGSAVDKENLSKELTRYRDAGWGGVHLVPIYGAQGWEPKFIEHLSPQWMEMLHHAVSEARRLGMDVDMTTGTGWPFGGPHVTSCHRVVEAGPRELRSRGRLALCRETAAATGGPSGDRQSQRGRPVDARHRRIRRIAVADCDSRTRRTARLDRSDGCERPVPLDRAAGEVAALCGLATGAHSARQARRAGRRGQRARSVFSGGHARYLSRFDAAFANHRGPLPRASITTRTNTTAPTGLPRSSTNSPYAAATTYGRNCPRSRARATPTSSPASRPTIARRCPSCTWPISASGRIGQERKGA